MCVTYLENYPVKTTYNTRTVHCKFNCITVNFDRTSLGIYIIHSFNLINTFHDCHWIPIWKVAILFSFLVGQPVYFLLHRWKVKTKKIFEKWIMSIDHSFDRFEVTNSTSFILIKSNTVKLWKLTRSGIQLSPATQSILRQCAGLFISFW